MTDTDDANDWGALTADRPEGDRDLTEFGVEPDDREREPRRDWGEREFGEDDRVIEDDSDDGEQAGLFPDCEEDQATLDGERASDRCLFGED